jgi:pimeloyl-ACP methyl ester carboxylesterase
MQASEILQAAVMQKDAQRSEYFAQAGLDELSRVTVVDGKQRIVVTIMRPVCVAAASGSNSSAGSGTNAPALISKSHAAQERKERSRPVAYKPGDLVISVTEEGGREAVAVAQLLRVLGLEPPLRVGGGTHEGVLVQPTLWRLAVKALQAVRAHLDSTDGHQGGHLPRPAQNVARHANSTTRMGDAAETVEEDIREAQVPQRVRVVGHSTGGAVAALMAIILDGGAFQPATTGITVDVADMEGTGMLLGEAAAHSASGGTVDFKEMGTLAGSFANRVHCTALGPPPCLSRQTVPRYINTFVCGDDLLPRAQPAALRTLRNRVLAALEAGAGRKRSLGYLMGTGLLQDFTKIAGNLTVLQRLLLVAADCYLCLYRCAVQAKVSGGIEVSSPLRFSLLFPPRFTGS